MRRRLRFETRVVLDGVLLLIRSREMSPEAEARLEGWRAALRDMTPVRSPRPRLHFSADRIDAMRAKRDTLPEVWEALRANAERALTDPLATHNDPALALRAGMSRAEVMCLVGLLDEREDLIDGAWRHVEPALGDAPLAENWVMDAHLPLRVDLGFAGMCAALASALDWAGDAWNPERRERVESELAARVALYHEIGEAQSEWWTRATHNWRSVICGEMGIAALSVRERVPNLADVLDLSLRGIDLVLNTEGDDGSHSEGVGYWAYGIGQAAWFGYVLKEATGGRVDLFEHPYLRLTGDYALHVSTPDGTCFSYEDGRPMPPSAWLCALLAATYRNPAYQWLANLGGPAPSIQRFLFTDPDLPAEVPKDAPTAAYFPDIETATVRSGWDANATFFGLHAGDTTVNHAHLDIGTIWLVGRGVRLIGDASVWPYDHGEYFFNGRGPRWDYEANATIGHNTILVNGEGQTYAPDCGGAIVHHDFGEEAATFVLDATRAYDGRLDRFVRYAAFVKPDLVVLVDDVRAPEPAQFAWLLHPEGETLDVDGTRWVAVHGTARLTVDLLGFETLGKGDGYRVGVHDRETFYHDRVDNPVRRRNRFVSFETLHATKDWVVTAVLRVGDADEAEIPRGRVERNERSVTVRVPYGNREWAVRCDFEARTIVVA